MAIPPNPTNLRWADAASATLTTPEASRRDSGWRDTGIDVPRAGIINYLANQVYLALVHLMGASAKYTLLQEAVIDLEVGDTAIVDEYDLDSRPGFRWIKRNPSLGMDIVSVDVSGETVVIAEGAGIGAACAALTRTLGTATLVAAYGKSNVGVNVRVITDGVVTVLAYGTFVELFNHDSGATQWVYNHGAQVNDICLDSDRVYLVGNHVFGNAARALNRDTGAVIWQFPHGDHLFSCATDGDRVYVAGNASTLPSGATGRALQAEDGRDITGEGGLGVAFPGRAWNIIQATTIAKGQCIATDGRMVYMGYAAAAGLEIEGRSCTDGLAITTFALAGGRDAVSLAVDHEFLFVAATTALSGVINCYDKSNLALVWSEPNLDDGGALRPVGAVATDGCAVFSANPTTPLGYVLQRHYRGNTPGIWRRVSQHDRYVPMRQAIVPHVR